jgi:hypothetical protein
MPKKGGTAADDHGWSDAEIELAYLCQTGDYKDLEDTDLKIKEELTIARWFGIPVQSWPLRKKNVEEYLKPGTSKLVNAGPRATAIYDRCKQTSRERLVLSCRIAVKQARDRYQEEARKRVEAFNATANPIATDPMTGRAKTTMGTERLTHDKATKPTGERSPGAESDV